MKRPGALAAALKWVIKKPRRRHHHPQHDRYRSARSRTSRSWGSKFDDADEKILAARLEEIRPYYCRMCGQCDGKCPQGLPVANMLRYLMYAESYGQFALGREHFLKLSAEHQGVRCADCPGCTVQCPQRRARHRTPDSRAGNVRRLTRNSLRPGTPRALH